MKDHSVPHSASKDGSVGTSVLERARNGDQAAFERIFSLYAGLVYHWCRKGGLEEADAYNVSQEVFLSVSRGISRFKREKPEDSFRGWLRVVTRSKIADHFRQAPKDAARGGEDVWLSNLSNSASESEDEEQSETLLLYERAIRLIETEFSLQDCTAFKLSVMDGQSANEVAAQLGISANSVYIARSRILKRLRVEFEDVMNISE